MSFMFCSERSLKLVYIKHPSTGHHPTFIRAGLTLVCALHAMIILEHLTILRALVADRGTKLT